MKDMQQISYANQAAAMAGRERFWLVDELEQLPVEDPVRVWVSWLCLYARDILNGTLPGPYDQQAAERYAREVLMPEEEFLPVASDPPAELAARFNVPVEQVDARLVDLAPPPHRRLSGHETASTIAGSPSPKVPLCRDFLCSIRLLVRIRFRQVGALACGCGSSRLSSHDHGVPGSVRDRAGVP